MRRVMFMINSLYGGGAERILQNIISSLDRSKYEITVYSMYREKIDPTLYQGEFSYRAVFDEYQGNLAISKQIYKVYAKIRGKLFDLLPSYLFYILFVHGKYDVEVAFIEGESTKIISGSPNCKSKKLAWVHIDLIQNPWTSFLYNSDKDESNHYEQFDEILCVSDSVKEAFVSKYKIDCQRVSTQYNPIDSQAIKRMSEEESCLPPKTRLRLISVGRLVEQKGFDRLLRIVTLLRDDGYDFELYILGEGEERVTLEKYILDNKLEERVYLIGHKKNPYPYMKASDLMVCSSRSEGFSTVVSEGVVLGLPIVSTECAGVKELFGNAKCGIITENDENALYQALHVIMQAPHMLMDYRKESLRRGAEFSLEKTMNEIENKFDK